MTTTRHARPALLGLVLLFGLAGLPARAEESRAGGPAAPPAEARRPASGLLTHGFSDFAEDNFAVAPAPPEAKPEDANRSTGPALPPPERRTR